jgi:hypothetical protein
MTTKLQDTPREKLATADREYKISQADYRAACDALQGFDSQHPTSSLDSKLKHERAQLEKAMRERRQTMDELHDAIIFCQREEFACRQNWGRGAEPWRR